MSKRKKLNASDFTYYNMQIKYYPNGDTQTIVGAFRVSNNLVKQRMIKSDAQEQKNISFCYWHGLDIGLQEYDPQNDPTLLFKRVNVPDDAKKVINERRSRKRALDSTMDYARSLDWTHFVTLTFDRQKVDSSNYDIVTLEIGEFNRKAKKRLKDYKYIAIPEMHKDKKHWHIHLLVASSTLDKELVDSGKKDKSGNQIYNWSNYEMGWTTVVKIKDPKADRSRVANYITKYMTKSKYSDIPKGKKKYWVSHQLPIPDKEYLNVESRIVEEMKESATYVKTTTKTLFSTEPTAIGKIEWVYMNHNL